jgi:hypothetical protein
MAAQLKPNPPDLDFEQLQMVANFSDYAVDCPNLSFEEIAKLLGVDFKANNGKSWEEACREAFERERGM